MQETFVDGQFNRCALQLSVDKLHPENYNFDYFLRVLLPLFLQATLFWESYDRCFVKIVLTLFQGVTN